MKKISKKKILLNWGEGIRKDLDDYFVKNNELIKRYHNTYAEIIKCEDKMRSIEIDKNFDINNSLYQEDKYKLSQLKSSEHLKVLRNLNIDLFEKIINYMVDYFNFKNTEDIIGRYDILRQENIIIYTIYIDDIKAKDEYISNYSCFGIMDEYQKYVLAILSFCIND